MIGISRIHSTLSRLFGMNLDSPSKSSSASTPTRPRTRSMSSREDIGSNSGRLDLQLRFRDEVDPIPSFVNGTTTCDSFSLFYKFVNRY